MTLWGTISAPLMSPFKMKPVCCCWRSPNIILYTNIASRLIFFGNRSKQQILEEFTQTLTKSHRNEANFWQCGSEATFYMLIFWTQIISGGSRRLSAQHCYQSSKGFRQDGWKIWLSLSLDLVQLHKVLHRLHLTKTQLHVMENFLCMHM